MKQMVSDAESYLHVPGHPHDNHHHHHPQQQQQPRHQLGSSGSSSNSSSSADTGGSSSSTNAASDSDSIVSANRSELSDASSSNYGGRMKPSDSLIALQVREFS